MVKATKGKLSMDSLDSFKGETFWAYGCIEFTSKDKVKHCEICEIYFAENKKVRDQVKPIGACMLSWADFLKDHKLVLKDLASQAKLKVKITCDEKGRMEVVKGRVRA